MSYCVELMRPAFLKQPRTELSSGETTFSCPVLHLRSTRVHPPTFSLAGTRCSRALANSFSGRSRWTSRPPRPFPSSFPPLLSLSRPRSVSSVHVGARNSKIQRIFLWRRHFFSPPPKLSADRPVLQQTRCWEACVSLQAALNTLCLDCSFPTFFPANQIFTKLLFTQPVHSLLSSPSLNLWAATIGQETTVISDCSSSRLQTGWAELRCHIITP